MAVETSIDTESTVESPRESLWERRDELIQQGFDCPDLGLIDALPGTGKSRGVIEWAAETGNPLTVLAPRHDLLDDEYEPWCDEDGLIPKRLPSFFRDCTSFDEDGDPVDYRAEKLLDDYQQGLSGDDLHSTHNDHPCQEDGECPYIEALSFDPDDYDVLLGTYRHAHLKDYIEDRYVVFDEFPREAFLLTFDEGVPSVVSAYLEETDLPYSSYFDLVTSLDNPLGSEAVREWKTKQHSALVDENYVRQSQNPDAHTRGPMALLALIECERLDNDWRYADLGQGRIGVRSPRTDEWTFLLPPDLDCAESVIGLDGTPNVELWRRTLNESVQTFHLHDLEGKRSYLTDDLGLEFIQTTENWKAIHSGSGASPPKDMALIEGIAHEEGDLPSLISSQKAIREYEQQESEGYGFEETIKQSEHYNALKGMNCFATERLGIVLGCPDPGHDEIEKWGTLLGAPAEAKGEGSEKRYSPLGDRVMQTFIHDEVLQAAMRFGREEVNGVRGATVYIHTSAIPEWVPVEKQIPEIHSWLSQENGVPTVIKTIRQLDNWQDRTWKTTELYDHVSTISNRAIRNKLDLLEEQGYIKNVGREGRSKCYENVCLEDAGWFGHVEFPE